LKSIALAFSIVSPFFQLPPLHFREEILDQRSNLSQLQEELSKQENEDSFFSKAGVYFCREKKLTQGL
jgi:hypothetical protein